MPPSRFSELDLSALLSPDATSRLGLSFFDLSNYTAKYVCEKEKCGGAKRRNRTFLSTAARRV